MGAGGLSAPPSPPDPPHFNHCLSFLSTGWDGPCLFGLPGETKKQRKVLEVVALIYTGLLERRQLGLQASNLANVLRLAIFSALATSSATGDQNDSVVLAVCSQAWLTLTPCMAGIRVGREMHRHATAGRFCLWSSSGKLNVNSYVVKQNRITS